MISIARGAWLLVPAALAGCSLIPGLGGGSDPFREADAPVTVVVSNENFNDATLWVVSRGGRRRLGMVTGKTQTSFTLTVGPAEFWQVEIDMIGGDRCITEELPVDPGDILEVRIVLELSRMPGCYPPGRGPRG